MKRTPLRRLIIGPHPDPDRIFMFSLWFRGHNNPRYAELLPRLRRLDRYLLVMPPTRVLRSAAYRSWKLVDAAAAQGIVRAGGARYRSQFVLDPRWIPMFPGPAVADVDDPRFTPEEAALLNSPNLQAYVVTAERAGRRYEELGVRTPFHIVPQGVDLSTLRPLTVDSVRRNHRRPGDFVVGYMAAWLLTRGDRGGEDPLYNVDHLLELWEQITVRIPGARLWLLGGASDRVRRLCAGRDDIHLFGLVPRDDVLSYVANFDVALYPRTEDQGIQSAKVTDYMGAGVPTVSYDYQVVEELRTAGAGLLVSTPRDFVAGVEALATDLTRRTVLADAARREGQQRSWDRLASRYETLFDQYLGQDGAVAP